MTMMASLLAGAGAARAQELQMSAQEQHSTWRCRRRPEYPRMGRAQEKANGALVTLEQVQKMPAIRIPRCGKRRRRFALPRRASNNLGFIRIHGGYTGDEIRGGSVGGGKRAFFVQQTVVTGGKLSRSREVFGKEVRLAEIEAEEQRCACKAR